MHGSIAGDPSREKTFVNWWNLKLDFVEYNDMNFLLVLPTVHRAFKQSRRKLSLIDTEERNSQKFSPSKVFHYTVLLGMIYYAYYIVEMTKYTNL